MTTRDRTVLAVIVAVALLAAYWLLLLAPKRDEAKKVGAEVTQAQQTASTSRSGLAAARNAKRSYSRNYAMIARLGQAVPTDDNVPSLVFQVESAARATHVDFRAVKLTGSTDASAATAVAPTPPATTTPAPTTTTPTTTTPTTTTPTTTTPAGTSSASSTTTASATAPATQAATATLPPGAAVGPAGFPTMPFSLTFDGSFFHIAAFFHRLQRFVDAGGHVIRVGGRLLTLDGVSLSASRKGFPRVKAVVAATAYLIPAGEGLTTATTTDGTTPASTTTGGTAAPAAAAVVR